MKNYIQKQKISLEKERIGGIEIEFFHNSIFDLDGGFINSRKAKFPKKSHRDKSKRLERRK